MKKVIFNSSKRKLGKINYNNENNYKFSTPNKRTNLYKYSSYLSRFIDLLLHSFFYYFFFYYYY